MNSSRWFRNLIFIILLLMTSLLAVSGEASQTDSSKIQHRLLLGFQPMVTVEPLDDRNVVDVNALPIVLEYALKNKMGIRGHITMNLRFGAPESPMIGQVGGGVLLPIYKLAKDERFAYHGFYGGPYLGFGYNLEVVETHLTVAGELGYAFTMSQIVTLNVGLQIGATRIWDDEGNKTWPHFGIIVSFGKWLK